MLLAGILPPIPSLGDSMKYADTTIGSHVFQKVAEAGIIQGRLLPISNYKSDARNNNVLKFEQN